MPVELDEADCDIELLAVDVACEEPDDDGEPLLEPVGEAVDESVVNAEAEDDDDPLLDAVDEGGAVLVLVDDADVLAEAVPEDEGD